MDDRGLIYLIDRIRGVDVIETSLLHLELRTIAMNESHARKIGDITVTTVSDGILNMNLTFFARSDARRMRAHFRVADPGTGPDTGECLSPGV